MSELDDFMAEGMTFSQGVMGTDEFTIDGRPYVGVLSEYEGEQEIELGGSFVMCNATLVCQRQQFRSVGAPLTRVLKNKIVVMDEVSYEIARVANDAVSVTLGLRLAT